MIFLLLYLQQVTKTSRCDRLIVSQFGKNAIVALGRNRELTGKTYLLDGRDITHMTSNYLIFSGRRKIKKSVILS